jgi:hypothetical protein
MTSATWYLQDCPSQGRMIIDKVKRSDCEQDREVVASCWLAAKRAFGFELTAMQEGLLAARRKK